MEESSKTPLIVEILNTPDGVWLNGEICCHGRYTARNEKWEIYKTANDAMFGTNRISGTGFETFRTVAKEYLACDIPADLKDSHAGVCAICHETFVGIRHNAEPYTTGYCCDKCNYATVVPCRKTMLETE